MAIIPVGGLIGLETGWFSGYPRGWGAVILGIAYVATPLAMGAASRWTRFGRPVLAGLAAMYLLAGLRFYLDGSGPVMLSVVAAVTVVASLVVFPATGNRNGHIESPPTTLVP